MKKSNKKAIGIILLLLVVGLVAFKVAQTAFPAGTYIQAPTFYYYECNAATEPTESTHVNIATGSSGWIIIPANTDTADLWVAQTETTKWYSNDRRFVYQICHNNGANCDPQVITGSNFQWALGPGGVPSIHIPNLLKTDRVSVNYQYQNLLFQWKDQANGAAWYNSYKPFILWKVNMFDGGKTEYTSIAQGCNFPSSTSQLAPEANGILYPVSKLLNSITNTVKTINTQTTTSNTAVPFYKTRNFIGAYIPLSTANVNFVTYNGQPGYCLQRQIFAITTATTNGQTYQIVDNNFNTRLSDSVACCPGETEPTRKCNANFQWDPIEEAQCSAINPCAGANWMPSSSKMLIRYNCVNSKCVAETKAVDCTTNSDCGANQVCDTLNYKCVNVDPGTITCLPNQTLVNGVCVNNVENNCAWYQEPYTTNTNDYGLFGWRYIFGNPIVNTQSGCKTSGLTYAVIVALAAIIIAVVYMTTRPRRKK